MLTCWGIPGTIQASQEMLRSGKATQASRWATDRFLFKFDRAKDEPVKAKQQASADIKNGGSLIDAKISDSSNLSHVVSSFISPGVAQAPQSLNESAGKPTEQSVSVPDTGPVASKIKKSAGPNLNDSTIKEWNSLFENRF